ncbi:MAG: NAD-dependent epimerase/dehydratase family protein [Pseudomonadota bacterium]
MRETDWAAEIGTDAPVLVTGAAGFIGYHLSERLLGAGIPVLGLDTLDPYYDPGLKRARLARLEAQPGFTFTQTDLNDTEALHALFTHHRVRHVANLAAQAGVRHSIDNPAAYAHANLSGFLSLLEACRRAQVAHLVYASSSSVYGGNTRLPFSVGDSVDHPVSLYAATKKANELMAHTYAHLYAIPATGLRFFTVYGPWGRPDMAYYLFTRALFEGRPIRLYNHGDMGRDFTYVDDVVEGIVRLIPAAPTPDPSFDTSAPDPGRSWAAHRVYNIGNRRAERLGDFLAVLERLTGRRAIRELAEMQPGDVKETFADVDALEAAVGFRPDTPMEEGLAHFVAWYRAYHQVG